MKKYLFLAMIFCSVLLVPFCGCQKESDDPQQTQGTQATQQTQADPSDIIQTEATEVLYDIAPTAPACPGNSLIAFDPNRELYFSCENIYVDFYDDTTLCRGISFDVLSKEKLDPSKIHLIVPIETPHEFRVMEIGPEEFCVTETMAENIDGRICFPFPYYLYQCYRGTDFTSIMQKKKEYDAFNASLLEQTTYTKEAFEKADQLEKELSDLRDAELAAYSALQAEDIPEFYQYTCSLNFLEGFDKYEAFTQWELVIDETVYTCQIGKVTLNPGAPKLKAEIAPMVGMADFLARFYYLYSDGLLHARAFDFTAEKDMTLTGIEYLTDRGEPREIIVTIQGEGISSEFVWDGEEPVYIRAGESVLIRNIFYSPLVENLSYTFTMPIALYFKTEEGTFSTVSDIMYQEGLTNGAGAHSLYAIVFQGLDMESYYRDYYNPIANRWLTTFMQESGTS